MNIFSKAVTFIEASFYRFPKSNIIQIIRKVFVNLK